MYVQEELQKMVTLPRSLSVILFHTITDSYYFDLYDIEEIIFLMQYGKVESINHNLHLWETFHRNSNHGNYELEENDTKV